MWICNNHHLSCDKAKSVWTRKYWFNLSYSQTKEIFFVSYCFCNYSIAYIFWTIRLILMGFSAKSCIPLIQKMKIDFSSLQTDFAWLHVIWISAHNCQHNMSWPHDIATREVNNILNWLGTQSSTLSTESIKPANCPKFPNRYKFSWLRETGKHNI